MEYSEVPFSLLTICSYIALLLDLWGARRQCSWLTHYATSRKVADSIPDEVTECFQFT
jgi:hypothetical protein